MDYFDRIEEYLKNTLSESDRIAFEEEMANDAALKQAVDNHEVAMDVVGSILESEVRGIIDNEQLIIDNGEKKGIINNEQLIIDNGDERNENGKLKVESGKLTNEQEGLDKGAKVRKMNWMRWGAAAIVVFVMGWWGMNQLFENNDSQLYASSYSDPTWPLERGQEASDLNASIAKYFNASKEEAKAELKSYSTSEANYWLSEVYFKEMNFDSTMLYLPQVANDLDNKRRDRINYLKILSLYFGGDKVEAKKAISVLPSDMDAYYAQIFSKLSF